jgi:hypothetical protein
MDTPPNKDGLFSFLKRNPNSERELAKKNFPGIRDEALSSIDQVVESYKLKPEGEMAVRQSKGLIKTMKTRLSESKNLYDVHSKTRQMIRTFSDAAGDTEDKSRITADQLELLRDCLVSYHASVYFKMGEELPKENIARAR